MLVVNFKEFFTISSYEVVEYWSRTENVMSKFKKVSDEIVVEKVQTLSYFDQQRPKHPCKICGSEMMTKENSSEETEVYVHDCSFNGEEIEDCLRELVQNELLQDGFTQEEFERNYG